MVLLEDLLLSNPASFRVALGVWLSIYSDGMYQNKAKKYYHICKIIYINKYESAYVISLFN